MFLPVSRQVVESSYRELGFERMLHGVEVAISYKAISTVHTDRRSNTMRVTNTWYILQVWGG